MLEFKVNCAELQLLEIHKLKVFQTVILFSNPTSANIWKYNAE